jgi:hypothetical protein
LIGFEFDDHDQLHDPMADAFDERLAQVSAAIYSVASPSQ